MGSSDEMYERGVQDAARDDFNPFYYQHYYHYRQGYNTTRRRLRRESPADQSPTRRFITLVLSLAGVLIVAWFGYVALQTNNASSESQARLDTATTLSPTAAASSTPRTLATATLPVPTPATPMLRIGGLALVANVGQAALLARRDPGLNSPVQARFPEGIQVTIRDGPIEADGLTWWQIEGPEGNGGWSAASDAEGVIWLQPQ
ncbi:MAG: SH3 domain-containing protein [Chloroflexales bacterium]|nr:SH3 domain-containing protein [Chloroflexales bacterium]